MRKLSQISWFGGAPSQFSAVSVEHLGKKYFDIKILQQYLVVFGIKFFKKKMVLKNQKTHFFVLVETLDNNRMGGTGYEMRNSSEALAALTHVSLLLINEKCLLKQILTMISQFEC